MPVLSSKFSKSNGKLSGAAWAVRKKSRSLFRAHSNDLLAVSVSDIEGETNCLTNISQPALIGTRLRSGSRFSPLKQFASDHRLHILSWFNSLTDCLSHCPVFWEPPPTWRWLFRVTSRAPTVALDNQSTHHYRPLQYIQGYGIRVHGQRSNHKPPGLRRSYTRLYRVQPLSLIDK